MKREHMERIQKLARTRCLISNDDCMGRIEIHHLTDGGRRMGDAYTVPLCEGHHRTGKDSYHKSKKPFMARHGSNEELLKKANKLLEVFDDTHF